MTGEKILPVLEIEGRTPRYMGESSNIIAYVEGLAGVDGSPQLIPPTPKRDDVADFLSSTGEFKVLQRILTRPIIIEMNHLMDWKKPEDVAYAKEKYTNGGFDYAAAKAQASEAASKMERVLVDLEKMMQTDLAMTKNEDGTYSWDDVLIVPELRTLSCAPNLKWPPQLRTYLTTALSKGGVGSYFSKE